MSLRPTSLLKSITTLNPLHARFSTESWINIAIGLLNKTEKILCMHRARTMQHLLSTKRPWGSASARRASNALPRLLPGSCGPQNPVKLFDDREPARIGRGSGSPGCSRDPWRSYRFPRRTVGGACRSKNNFFPYYSPNPGAQQGSLIIHHHSCPA